MIDLFAWQPDDALEERLGRIARVFEYDEVATRRFNSPGDGHTLASVNLARPHGLYPDYPLPSHLVDQRRNEKG